MHQWILDHFFWLYLGSVAWCVGGMTYMLWRRKIRGPHFPSRDQVNVLFDERWTSGRSLKSLLTRLGGANNCLRVTVTDSELWIAPHFPFSAFGSSLDLDHRVERSAIASIKRRGKPITVEWMTPNGEPKAVELRLRRPLEFVAVLSNAAAAESFA